MASIEQMLSYTLHFPLSATFHCASKMSSLDTIFILCTYSSVDLTSLMHEQRLINSSNRPNLSQGKSSMVWTNLSAETAPSAGLTHTAPETCERFQLIQPKYKIGVNLPNNMFYKAQYFLILGAALWGREANQAANQTKESLHQTPETKICKLTYAILQKNNLILSENSAPGFLKNYDTPSTSQMM